MFFHYFQAGQTSAAKNQKSITQFFSQKHQKSPIKCVLSQSENHEKKSVKRKELSPVQSQNIDRTDEPCSSNSTNNFYIDINGLNTQKKIKLDHGCKKMSPLKTTVHKAHKTTPEKENINRTTLSPRKNSSNKKKLKGNVKKTKESDDISENKNNWSPLTNISMDGVLDMNEFHSNLDQNDEFNRINGLVNENLVNKRVKSPRKVLQFHDHDQNDIIEIKKCVTVQKSPEKGKVYAGYY